jgi:hypothetical protein
MLVTESTRMLWISVMPSAAMANGQAASTAFGDYLRMFNSESRQWDIRAKSVLQTVTPAVSLSCHTGTAE